MIHKKAFFSLFISLFNCAMHNILMLRGTQMYKTLEKSHVIYYIIIINKRRPNHTKSFRNDFFLLNRDVRLITNNY